jgi:hypothetical protein
MNKVMQLEAPTLKLPQECSHLNQKGLVVQHINKGPGHNITISKAQWLDLRDLRDLRDLEVL